MNAAATVRLLIGVTLVLALATAVAEAPVVGHAAGTPVSSGRLSTFRPSALPPACTTQTLVAAADAWVNEQQTATNNGSTTPLNVTARNGRNAWAYVRFTLPAAPSGCTLVSATLRAFNGSATSGRTLSAYRAGASWTELGITWTNKPAVTGTAVDITSAAGWLQWGVTTHVQTMYSGANDGFVLYDAVQGGGTTFTHAFDSREGTNKPELILQWGS